MRYVTATALAQEQAAAAETELPSRTSTSLAAELARRDIEDRAVEEERKVVTPRAYGYLNMAQAAIDHTKGVIQYQGNQLNAIRQSRGNSYRRLQVMRNPNYWEYDSPETEALAWQDYPATVAAKADLVQGGNCGEHAAVAYNYLRSIAKGVKLQMASYEGLDHAFVILGELGNPKAFPDSELVVSDPWPNSPKACLWEDHFAYQPDRAGIEVTLARVGDGKNNKERIKAGLTLTKAGLEHATSVPSAKEYNEMIKHPSAMHFWNHENAAKETEFEYFTRQIEATQTLSPRTVTPLASVDSAPELDGPALTAAALTAPVAPPADEVAAERQTATVNLPEGTGWYRVSVLLQAQGIEISVAELQALNPGKKLFPGNNTVNVRR